LAVVPAAVGRIRVSVVAVFPSSRIDEQVAAPRRHARARRAAQAARCERAYCAGLERSPGTTQLAARGADAALAAVTSVAVAAIRGALAAILAVVLAAVAVVRVAVVALLADHRIDVE